MPSNFRDKNGKDPFSDEQGLNPYADDGQDVPAADADHPYAAPAGETYTYRPGDFETFLPHRGGRLLTVALLSLLVAAAGLPIWYFVNAPIGVLAFAGTIPVCVMAVLDLRAMRLGAMDSAGSRRTAWAGLLALVGSALAVANGVLIAGRVLYYIRTSSF